jgi:hypothetical protein
MQRLLPLFLALPACSSSPPPIRPPLQLAWEKDMLSVVSSEIPGGKVDTWYLEACCRSGSTRRDWELTTIPHRTEKLPGSTDRKVLLRTRVEGGVELHHTITAGEGAVDFDVEAVNRGPAYVDIVWVQPCTRVGTFTGGDQESYVARSFIFLEGEPKFLTETRRTEDAIYRGGQVYVPAGIDREDVNPRPLSPDVPSNRLIGCVSADGKMLLALAWEPYQELFQGVIVCLHSDFRLGGLAPGETKRARGRMYIMENDPGTLLELYERDF